MTETKVSLKIDRMAFEFEEQQKSDATCGNSEADLKSYINVVVSHVWHPVSYSVRAEKVSNITNIDKMFCKCDFLFTISD